MAALARTADEVLRTSGCSRWLLGRIVSRQLKSLYEGAAHPRDEQRVLA